ncbi:MAG: recombination-associated protein RdgC [Polyangiaceae bacterium]|nr:recombination-associated protein RdgC [Polyangiaceae bacterium]MCW5791726.1 recombination-associated protein RdgC [Polyangiaceae bacterium]
MGALRGALSFTRFFVRGELPDDFRERTLRAIKLRRFEPLTPEDEESERSGWCVIDRLFDLDFDHEKVFYNSYLNLGFRVDSWRVPAALLKAQLAEAEEELRVKKGLNRLGRAQKADLKQRITVRLRRRTLPSSRSYDVSWNLETGVLLFWSHSKRLIEELTVQFEKTFSLQLVPESPFMAAVECGLTDEQLSRLRGVEETAFFARSAGSSELLTERG